MKRFAVIFAIMILAQFTAWGRPARASDTTEARGLVEKAKITFVDFQSDKNLTWFHEYLKKAKGLLIFPQVLKGGFFVGGSGAVPASS